MTCPRDTKPSIRLSNCATTRFSTSPGTSARLGATASISSMNRMAGAARRLFEDLAELALALAVELPHDLRTVEMDEVHAAFCGNGSGKKGLACSWRSAQQHALRREDAEPLEDAGVLERELDDLADSRDSRSSPPMSSYDTAGARAPVCSPSTTRMSVRFPMMTAPDGIVRTT